TECTENLIGAKVGEERTFKVIYRAEYPTAQLAGKTVAYKVKVEALKTKETPEVNDEFAQRFGDYKALDELKAKLREDLEKHKRDQAQEQMREKLLERLGDKKEIEITQTLVERGLPNLVHSIGRD